MALTQEQFMQLMGGKREPVTASLASVLDLIKKPLDYYAVDKRVPLVGGQSAADLIGLTGTQSLVQDFSQGKPMMRDGIADERFIDAASMIPMLKPAAIGTGQAAKYLGKEALRQGYEGTGVLGKIAPDMNMYAVPNNSPFVPNVKAGEELLVQHNLSPEKLIAANKLGGMPVPSLAINKLNNPISGFGDISLIGSKEMAIPSAKNPVYKSDAYTKRAPSINYNIDFKSQRNLENLLSDVIEKVPSGQAKFGSLTQDYKYRADNKLLKAQFLKDQNLLPDRSLFPDDYKYGNEIDNLVNENTNKYSSWLNNFESNLPSLGVNVELYLRKTLEWCDAANMLRIQLERQDIKFIPSIREYRILYGLDKTMLDSLSKKIVIMHPGPINRGVEITSEVADGSQSIILDQVENGVAVRMAAMFLLAGK